MARSEVDPCDHADEGNNSSNMENSEETGALVVRDRPDDEDGDTNGLTSEERKSEEQQLQPQQQQPQQQLPSKWESFASVAKSLIIRSLIIFFVVSYFRKPQTDPASPQGQAPARIQASNIFHNGTLFDLYVYLSEDESFRGFNDPKTLIWSERELIYGDWYGGENGDGSRELEYAFVPSSKLKNNGSIYLHVYVTRHGKLPNPEAGKDKYSKNDVAYARRMLNKFKKIKYEKKHNLLTGETTASEEAVKKAEIMQQEIVSHWHPNMTINLVTDQTNWVFGQIPPPIDTYFEFLPGHRYYKPVIYLNDFWNMQRDYKPLNDSVEELTLRLTYKPISLLKWEIYAAQQSTRQKWLDTFLGDTTEDDDSDQDTLKETLLDTNPYLLGMTFAVSILHSIFEFLAFKNDIEFWNNRQSLEGLSVRSVFFNVFQSLVVLLYVLDNATNTVVRISCMVGLAIEIWKINKVVDIRVNRERKILGIFPSVSFHDKGSYVESSTKKYDRLAFEYLSWALYPLLGGYAVYSLMYLEHKGWYSWVLSMLYGFLLTFGFIMMTPQLFINYKLKSVAHLPWRMMSYKFFNTFIDDIFAFVIKMPTLYRLGCFRDDIVFFIFLYQRWIYKTDHTRVNEFGFSGEMEAKLAAEKRQKAIAAPVPETNSAKAESSKKTD